MAKFVRELGVFVAEFGVQALKQDCVTRVRNGISKSQVVRMGSKSKGHFQLISRLIYLALSRLPIAKYDTQKSVRVVRKYVPLMSDVIVVLFKIPFMKNNDIEVAHCTHGSK